jgi:hypothetical protein
MIARALHGHIIAESRGMRAALGLLRAGAKRDTALGREGDGDLATPAQQSCAALGPIGAGVRLYKVLRMDRQIRPSPSAKENGDLATPAQQSCAALGPL